MRCTADSVAVAEDEEAEAPPPPKILPVTNEDTKFLVLPIHP